MFRQLFKNNPDKAEMSFFDHLEELRWHIIRSLIAVVIAATLVFIFIRQIYNDIIMGPTHPDFITYRLLCQIDRALHLGNKLCLQSLDIHFQNLEVSGQFMLSLTSSVVIGAIVSVPYILWEFWRFINPPSRQKRFNMPGELFSGLRCYSLWVYRSVIFSLLLMP